MIEGVFFDLDGTLADTAPDLAAATNQLLVNEGRSALPVSSLRPFVSGGSPALINIAFGLKPGDEDFERLKSDFLAIYASAYLVETHLFSGMSECLELLETKNIPWGIVTNKPEFLTGPLLKDMKLDRRASVVISGDTYPVKKPDPYPLIQACRLAGVNPLNSIYIGDDERDIVAAKAAGMVSVCAQWGYLAGQDPHEWHADHYVERSDHLTQRLVELIG